MSRTLYVSVLGSLLAIVPVPAAEEYRISGPYVHENLSIFLIHGSGGPSGKRLLTLQEALEQKKVVVYETGNVGELAIENLSPDDVYIQSGDIVKGGRQDRVFPYDYLVPSHSGKLPISSFCVERGRWSRRGSEPSQIFSGSQQRVAFKALKVAMAGKGGQTEVWDRVAEAQDSLTRNVSASVAAPASPSSMMLSLENKNVTEKADKYISTLAKIIDGKSDVTGYAFAINGKLNSADVYASPDLFRRLWPKLVRASAVEALSEKHRADQSSAVDVAAVRAILSRAARGRESSKEVTPRVHVITRETEKELFLETRDREHKGAWIHRSYVVK